MVCIMRILLLPLVTALLMQLAPSLPAADSKKDAPSVQSLLDSGNKKLQADDHDGAIADLSKVIQIAPKDFRAYFGRSVAREAKGDLKGALADLSKVIELKPQDSRFYDFRGKVRQKMGNLDGALADFSKAIVLNPKFGDAYFDRGGVYDQKMSIKAAIADYSNAITLDPTNFAAYARRGSARSYTDDSEGALADFTKAIEHYPKTAFLYSRRGEVRYDSGDPKGALVDYTKAIELDPKEAGPYVLRGQTRRGQGDLDGALADYNKAIELDPEEHARAISGRGFVFALQGDWPKAYRDFDSAFVSAKWKTLYHPVFRCISQMRLGKLDEAKKELIDAMDKRWDVNPGGWDSTVADFLLGKRDEAGLLVAAEDVDEGTRRRQKCAAWYFAGVARLASGQEADAANCFRRCVATEEKNKVEYDLAQAELRRLK
jgi:tetratricopeptide (TPR) repeat protein